MNPTPLNSLIDLVQQMLSEHACTDVLPNWLCSANQDPEATQRLMEAWSETQKLLHTRVVSLNPIDQLVYSLNEKAESKVVRIIQLYQLVRMRKIFEEPSNVLTIQAENEHALILEDSEKKAAERWKRHILDHDLMLPDCNASCYFGHVFSSVAELDFSTYSRMITAEEDDDAVEKLKADARAVADKTGYVTPDNLVVCYAQDTFRQGFYKGRLHARQ